MDYNTGFRSEPLASLAFAYEENNPVNNALVSNVLGTLSGKKTPKAPKISIWCEVCNIEFNSQVTYDNHINGAKHAKKLKAKEILKSLQEEGAINGDEDTVTLKCSVCDVIVNSSQQLQMHLSGSKHKAKCRKSEGMETSNSNDGLEPTVAKQARLYCDICSLSLNSDQQYQQHIASKKHKDKSEGKTPAKKKKNKKGGSGKSNNAGFTIPPLSQSFLQTSTMA